MPIADAGSKRPSDFNDGGYASPKNAAFPSTEDAFPYIEEESFSRRQNYLQVMKRYPGDNPAIFWSVVGVVVTTILVWVVWGVFFHTKQVSAEISGKHWQRQIEVEKFKTVRESDWDYPSDAYHIDSYLAIHHYQRVYQYTRTYPCGTSDRPRTCSEDIYSSVPVYATKYDYDVDRWRTERWLTTQGDYDAPTWAAIPSSFVDIATLGNERQGNESRQTYTLKVLCDHKKCNDSLGVGFDQFISLTEHQKVIASVTITGNVRSVKTGVAAK